MADGYAAVHGGRAGAGSRRGLVAVSRRPPTDAAVRGLTACWGPDQVVDAWR